jgi:two-component system response regulator HydG
MMKTPKGRILVVDDSVHILTTLKQLLKREVETIEGTKKPELLMEKLSRDSFNLVLLDMNFKAGINTGNEGIYWLKEIKRKHPDLPVLMITAYGNIDLAVRCMKEGAEDFITKPWEANDLIEKVRSILTRSLVGALGKKKSEPVVTDSNSGGFLGKSEPVTELLKKVERVAETSANILLTGENGTGKNLVAGLIHQKSALREQQMISIDVGALSESLFESELFGYSAGAFTDAKEDRSGKLELANNSTLFLDEIANISLQQQQKLLSVLQEKQFCRLGSSIKIRTDFRLVCATNQNLQELVSKGLFREDLFYRINTIEICIPPLRERKVDILILASYFLKIFSQQYNRKILGIAQETTDYLMKYAWPGNVRQLAHEIEKAVILCTSDTLEMDPITSQEARADLVSTTNLSDIEKQTILRVLEKNRGNLSKSASELGISRSTLYVKIEKYDIQ